MQAHFRYRRRSPRPPPPGRSSVGPSVPTDSGARSATLRCAPGRVRPPCEGACFRLHRLTAAVAASAGRQINRMASVVRPIASGKESPFSGPVPAERGCWRGPNPAGFTRQIEQRVSFLPRPAHPRRVKLWMCQPILPTSIQQRNPAAICRQPDSPLLNLAAKSAANSSEINATTE